MLCMFPAPLFSLNCNSYPHVIYFINSHVQNIFLYRYIMSACAYHRLHICVTCVFVWLLKTPAGGQNKPSISLLCSNSALYSPPYYTEWTITAGPISATRWHRTGPICGMKHQSQLHLCVFLIHPSLHPSNLLPPPHPPPPLICH